MTPPASPPRILALDIGTSAVRALLAEPNGDDIALVALGTVPCFALRKGWVANPSALVAALRDAALAAGVDSLAMPVYVGLPAQLPRAREESEKKATDAILHCCEQVGLTVSGTIPTIMATTAAVVTAEEKSRGVAVIDIGAGPTKFAIFVDGALSLTGTVEGGGNQVTSDLALGVRTPIIAAARIIIERGCAIPNLVGSDEMVEVPSLGGRPNRWIERRSIAEWIHDRLMRILSDLRDRLAPMDPQNRLGAGIVLTGGLSRMPAIADLAQELLRIPVRLGTPQVAGRADLGPEYATVVGLAQIAVSAVSSASRMSLEVKEAAS